ncbi:hypothetical protein CDCA_CDCA12G3407 [Cyanidium caldarium]|uniref:ADP-ribosylation factor n=1 Tax=Cyanidium caldarium TaxID=2771 RepID=A0AAV9IYN5_CYACA|nr:hypothetical protein CDCA_CDCA12G3407 [Cyanidium caldarium]
MGAVISSLWDRLYGRRAYRICMVGLDGAGKTTLLYRLRLGEVVETTPTIGCNVETVRWGNVQLQVWDLSGQQGLRASWQAYFAGTDALIVVADAADVARLGELRTELERVLQMEAVADAVVLVWANKQDKHGEAVSAVEVSERLRLHQRKQADWHIEPCSAVTGDGLEAGMRWLVDALAARE